MIDQPRLLELLGRQSGVATTRQLLDLGVSRTTISRAVAENVLLRVTASVVRLAGYELTFEARAMAAWLHCGPRSFLSATTAGAIHGLRYMPRSRTQVVVLGRTQVDVPLWLSVSRTTWMLAGDVIEHPAGYRIASPLRLLHQLAAQFRSHPHRFDRAAEDAWHLGLVGPAAAADYLEQMRRQGRTGVAMLESWLERAGQRPRPAQSGLEMDALAAVRRAGLPDPVRQYPLRLADGTVIHLDLAWPELRLGVEPGHSWFHGGDLGQRSDQARSRRAAEVGWYLAQFDESMREDLTAAGQQIRRLHHARRAPRPA